MFKSFIIASAIVFAVPVLAQSQPVKSKSGAKAQDESFAQCKERKRAETGCASLTKACMAECNGKPMR